jgi:hypothetical protein
MAINKNHEFEDLDGVKCAVVEKNAGKDRVSFLKDLLEFNNYKVIVVPSPPPKAAQATAQATAGTPAPKPAEGEVPVVEVSAPPADETFTVGVTNVMFNVTNALFGRLLKTKDGHIVTPAYWQQKDPVSHDEAPYYEQTP